MPFVADVREATTDPVGELLAEFACPLPHRFVADDDAAGGQQLLHHAQPKREAEIQPDRVADDLGGKPIPARARYSGYRFPPEIISHAVWLYFRFPLGLRMVEELLAARGIIVSHETVRQWARKFGQQFANRIRRRLPHIGDKWHLDEVVLKIAGVNHWGTVNLVAC